MAFLTIGHKNDDGSVHRKQLFGHPHGGSHFYHYDVKNNFPDDGYELQVECWNYNCSKRRADWDDDDQSYSTKSRRKAFMEVVKRLGGKCVCCGESNPRLLTIGHPNNDGAGHRRKLGVQGFGRSFHRLIIIESDKHQLTDDKLDVMGHKIQLECFNCNCGKNSNGGICPHKTGVGIIEAAPTPYLTPL